MWNTNNNHPEVKLRSHSQLLDCPEVPVGKVFGLLGILLLSRLKSGVFVRSAVRHYHEASGEGTRDDEFPACSRFLAASVARLTDGPPRNLRHVSLPRTLGNCFQQESSHATLFTLGGCNLLAGVVCVTLRNCRQGNQMTPHCSIYSI